VRQPLAGYRRRSCKAASESIPNCWAHRNPRDTLKRETSRFAAKADGFHPLVRRATPYRGVKTGGLGEGVLRCGSIYQYIVYALRVDMERANGLLMLLYDGSMRWVIAGREQVCRNLIWSGS
jgi:hypothetical protein